jgi:hypothetical protein
MVVIDIEVHFAGNPESFVIIFIPKPQVVVFAQGAICCTMPGIKTSGLDLKPLLCFVCCNKIYCRGSAINLQQSFPATALHWF